MNVRLYGHLCAAFGLAGGAKATARALRAAGCSVLPIDLVLPTHAALANSSELTSKSSLSDLAAVDAAEGVAEVGGAGVADSAMVHVDLVHTNPNVLASSPELLANHQLTAPVRIGYWAWELEEFPRGWERFFADYQEIWCPSSFTAQALAQRAPVPVVAVPHLPDWPRLERLNAERFSQPAQESSERPFTFFTLFDYWSTVERKNPLGVIEAFETAFPRDDPAGPAVRLTIKTSSSEQFLDKAAALRRRTAHDPRMQWLDALLPQDQLDALYLKADALVSLHRAEGFGLTLAEAMGMGIPVIATGYSGCMDFMPPGSGCLIPWSMQPIPRTFGDYVAGAYWAEPSIKDAAAAMRQLACDPAWSRQLGQQGRSVVSERLSQQRVTAVVRQRLGHFLLPA